MTRCDTRTAQYRRFMDMVILLLLKARESGLLLRLGEAHRPAMLCEIYAKHGIGIVGSKHRYSLSLDLWIVGGAKGQVILWESPHYKAMGKYWESIGGIWGGRFKRKDEYHFEFQEDPII
jgi:hypothetical protein